MKVSVMWRGNKYTIEIDPNSNLKDLGYELRNLTGVTAETLRLIVPRLNEKGSNLLLPFSDEHSFLSLHESSITEGKTMRMMGVTEEEFNGVQKDAMPDMRILGFEDEERRLRLKKFSSSSIKLPQGPYIFCAFRTLQLPGIELNPPPADALKRMHMLASDPGIIAIMNKHRWRVGIMTELAPVGYVGVSPKCLLGFNKNQGEEISLRLRTDDLKGFRKYQSIKKTLLHELAHMVYTEHDEKFYALDSQLNKEAESLDWTKSRGHTLNGAKVTKDFDDEEDLFDEIGDENFSQRLGGDQYDDLGNARESSVAAAYRRLSHTSASKLREEPDPDDSVDVGDESKQPIPPEAHSDSRSQFEPDPDDAIEDASTPEHHSGSLEPDPDDVEARTSIGEVENMEISNDTVMSDGNLTRPPGETNAEVKVKIGKGGSSEKMASIAASSTFHSFSTTKSPNLSSTHLLPLSKNLTFRTKPIGNSRVCSFTKQNNRLGLKKLSSLGEGGVEAVAVADEEQQQQQQETVSVPVSPSDMLTMFFQADGTLNEAAIPNVTKALQDMDGVSNLKVQVSEGVAVVELSKQTTVQATGVASSLVETIQGAGFKLQTLNLSFEDEDEVLV